MPKQEQLENFESAESIAAELQDIFIKSGKTLATAESCTGGLLARILTEKAGASAYYLGGIVSYSNLAKIRLLKVPKATLQQFTAVSPQTAKAMAEGVQKELGSDFAISTTGLAGPGGGSEELAVGTVYFGLAELGKETKVFYHLFPAKSGRAEIRAKAAEFILKKLKANAEF